MYSLFTTLLALTALGPNSDDTRPASSPINFVAGGGGGATLTVAAGDATPAERFHADYLCDGSADQVELQSALDALVGRGGSVELTSGTFLLDAAVRPRGSVHLYGWGKGTVLKASSAFTSGLGVIDGFYDGTGDPLDLVSVSNLVIDGNRFQGANTRGVHFDIRSKSGFLFGSPDAHLVLTDLFIARTSGHGVHIEGSFNRAARVTRIRVWDVDGDGFHVASPDGNYTDCDTGSSAGYGFRIESANNHFSACKAWYSDEDGWFVNGVRNTLASCSSQDNEKHGFRLSKGMVTLTGCHADSNSYLGGGANPDANQGLYDGFHIDANNITLAACFAYDKNEGGRGRNQRYGTYVNGAKQRLNLQVSNGNTPGTGSHNNFTGGLGGTLTGTGNAIVSTGQDG